MMAEERDSECIAAAYITHRGGLTRAPRIEASQREDRARLWAGGGPDGRSAASLEHGAAHTVIESGG